MKQASSKKKNIPCLYQPSSLTIEAHFVYGQTANFTMLIRNRYKLYAKESNVEVNLRSKPHGSHPIIAGCVNRRSSSKKELEDGRGPVYSWMLQDLSRLINIKKPNKPKKKLRRFTSHLPSAAAVIILVSPRSFFSSTSSVMIPFSLQRLLYFSCCSFSSPLYSSINLSCQVYHCQNCLIQLNLPSLIVFALE